MLNLQKLTISACLAQSYEQNLTEILEQYFIFLIVLEFYEIKSCHEKILNEADGFWQIIFS